MRSRGKKNSGQLICLNVELIDKEPKPLFFPRSRRLCNEGLLTSTSREIRVCKHEKRRSAASKCGKYFPGMRCPCRLAVYLFIWLKVIFRYNNMRSGIIKKRIFAWANVFIYLSASGLIFSILECLLLLYFPSTR